MDNQQEELLEEFWEELWVELLEVILGNPFDD
jgi:hypothetical protein